MDNSNEYNFQELKNLDFNDKEIDMLFTRILSLREGVKLQGNSYTTNKEIIEKINLKNLFEYIEQYKTLSDIKKPTIAQIKNHIENFKNAHLKRFKTVLGYQGELNNKNEKDGLGYYSISSFEELIGVFKNNIFSEGEAFNNGKSLYSGKYFNQKDKPQFKGVFYPDLSQNVVCIGEVSYSIFKGISINSINNAPENEEYYIQIITSKFQIVINTKELGVVHFSVLNNPTEKNNKYSFKEKKYLTNSSFCTNKCFFNISEITKSIISYETPNNEIEPSDNTNFTILYPENKVYIGHLDPKNNYCLQGEATFLIRLKFHSDILYKIEGVWDKGYLIKGKVYTKEGTLIYDGQFENNQPSHGIYYYGNGEQYEGDFENFQRHGKGKYKYENGDVFDGEFLNNLPRGDGNFIDSEGLKQKITILDNIIVR